MGAPSIRCRATNQPWSSTIAMLQDLPISLDFAMAVLRMVFASFKSIILKNLLFNTYLENKGLV
jgi:hypothetical protein